MGWLKDDEGRFFLFGPAATDTLSREKLMEYRRQNNIKEKDFLILKSSWDKLSNILSIAYYYFCGKKIKEAELIHGWEEKDIASEAALVGYQLEKSEMNRQHNSTFYEAKLEEAVKNGDVEGMKKLMGSNGQLARDNIGIVAKNDLKQMEYLCVSSVTLLSRAAVKGGLNQELAYDLSDTFLQLYRR